jgi:hypothetical protein
MAARAWKAANVDERADARVRKRLDELLAGPGSVADRVHEPPPSRGIRSRFVG